MRLSLLSIVTLSVGLFVVGCGKGNQPDPKASDAVAKDNESDGVLRGITNGQLKVAHYATGDGVVGFVLDRTASPAKVRIDGEKDIIELTMEEDRHSGERRGWYMKSPDGKNVLYLSSHGALTLFKGRDSLHVNSDKKADPLPAATVTGQYVAPKSSYDTQIEALAPRSVLKKLPQFKPEESGNLAKITEALNGATPDMIFHVTAEGAKHGHWAPASGHIGNTHYAGAGGVHGPADDAWDKAKASGVGKYGGVLLPMRFEFNSPNRLHLFSLKGWSSEIAANTPGILWEVDSGTIVFVTFDGGRYEIPIGHEGAVVEQGAGPQASWPAPLQHTLIDVDSVRTLAKGNVVPEQVGKDIEAVDDGWWSCVNDQWKKAKEDIDKAQASQISANDKWGKIGGIRKSAELAAPKTCDPKKKAIDAALTKFIEQRNGERTALFEKMKAKYK